MGNAWSEKVERELDALGVNRDDAAAAAHAVGRVNGPPLVLVLGHENDVAQGEGVRAAMLDSRSGELVTTWDAEVVCAVRLWRARRVVVVAVVVPGEVRDVEWMISFRRPQFSGLGPLSLDQQLPPEPPASAIRVEAADVCRVPVAR